MKKKTDSLLPSHLLFLADGPGEERSHVEVEEDAVRLEVCTEKRDATLKRQTVESGGETAIMEQCESAKGSVEYQV